MIQDAFEDALKKAFAFFWHQLATSTSDAQTADLEPHFKRGVEICRNARDCAWRIIQAKS